jgi:thiol-disulfide isomerase/thioredoxin
VGGAVVVGAAVVAALAIGGPTRKAAMDRLPVEGTLPSLGGATAWLGSPPLSADGLRGRVVLVDFWTYTCINWLRTAPYVRAWSEAYRDAGLVVIGVHAPEFAFERDIDQVRRVARELGIGYPIAIDNEHAIWRAFRNQYWPALYFIDAQGQIRHHHFGEGDYEASEAVLRQLLVEAGAGDLDRAPVTVAARGIEAGADWRNLRSPETYVGAARTASFASPGGVSAAPRHRYAVPAQLQRNQWALAGVWSMDRDAARVGEAGGRIAYRFHARDVHLVMAPAGGPVRFRIRIDGRPPGAAHGLDVDGNGDGVVIEPRLYQLVRQPGPFDDRQLEIEFLDAGVAVFAFTFG